MVSIRGSIELAATVTMVAKKVKETRADRWCSVKHRYESFGIIESASSLIANVDIQRVGFAADPPKLDQ